jgi:hypothetical protein
MTVYSENNKKSVNTLCGQTAESFNAKAGATFGSPFFTILIVNPFCKSNLLYKVDLIHYNVTDLRWTRSWSSACFHSIL